MAISDLDGDGLVDIVVTSDAADDIAVLRNTTTTGTITFASSELFSAGDSPRTVAIGDLNGDNKPDLVVSNASSDNISVFRNTGTVSNPINFSRTNYTTGNEPLAALLTDFDGDGQIDVAVSNANDGGSGSVSVYRNTSTSTISFATRFNFSTEDDPRFVVSGDFDGDGQPDIATANSNTPGSLSILRSIVGPPKIASILRNNPSSQFTNQTTLSFRVTFTEPVTGVGQSDFTRTLTGTATGNIVSVTTVSSSVYDVNLSGVGGNGTIALGLIANPGIRDASNNDFVGEILSTQSYTIDNTPPTASASFTRPAVKTGDSQTVTITTSENLSTTPRITITGPSGVVVNNQLW